MILMKNHSNYLKLYYITLLERHIGKVGPGTRDPSGGTLRVGPIGWDPSGGNIGITRFLYINPFIRNLVL